MRLLITGNGGSGKTWLGERLADRMQMPLLRLDDVYWAGDYGGQARDKQAVFDDVLKFADGENWVIEGVYGWLLPAALPRASDFVFIDLPVDECIANLRRRGHQGGGSEESFEQMLEWVAEYPARTNWNSRQTHERQWEQFAARKHRLSTRSEVDDFLAAHAH